MSKKTESMNPGNPQCCVSRDKLDIANSTSNLLLGSA